MNKLKLKSSLIFILIYVVLANIGTILSRKIDVDYLGEILLLSVLAVCLIIYMKKNKLTIVIGLTKISFYEMKKNLLYLPLFIMVLANGVFFFDRTIAFKHIVLSIGFTVLVAFLEELLFRGLLFKSIEVDNTTKTSIFISGATFGFGHIINLFNGYTVINQVIQIVLAILIGIILSILFVRTKSIIPGMIIFIIGLIYLFYLLKSLQQNEHPLE